MLTVAAFLALPLLLAIAWLLYDIREGIGDLIWHPLAFDAPVGPDDLDPDGAA